MIYKFRVIHLLIFVFLFYNCNRSNNSDLVKEKNMETEEIEYTSPKKNIVVNSDLISYEHVFIEDADPYEGPEFYEFTKMDIKYLDDKIQVTGIVKTNACDCMIGNVEIKGNELKLLMINNSCELCMSCSKFSVKYLFKNIHRKKYKIKFEYIK